MSVSKSKATSTLLQSEKKSLRRFLALYVSMVAILIFVLAALYYTSQVQLKLSNAKAELAKYAYIQTKRLKVLHHFFPEQRTYPRDPRFTSAIYDIESQKIFSLLRNDAVDLKEGIYFGSKGDTIYLVKALDEFYLGARYLIIETEDDGAWLQELWIRIASGALVGFGVLMLFGVYLARLFLKPMRESIMLLDRFIKDTTHELNTPLSAILANIEAMDTEVMVEKNKKKLNRIHIAARTVSNLYKDLTFLTLEQGKQEEIEIFDLARLIRDRAEYFRILAASKRLSCDLDLESVYIKGEKKKITRLVDNLISNAIKYNKRGGKIGISLKRNRLEVYDTGIGIDESKISFIFDRYMRFSDQEGGFGVGLSIVKAIAKEYDIAIEVQSEKNKGTRFILTFAANTIVKKGEQK